MERSPSEVQIANYWLDRYEVTNKDFKQFVDAGGYRKAELWKQPFLENGRPDRRRVHPGGFAPFSSEDVDAFSNQSVSLEEAWGARARPVALCQRISRVFRH
jgi:formylglycine-generating enzyme required for sulfatase activity